MVFHRFLLLGVCLFSPLCLAEDSLTTGDTSFTDEAKVTAIRAARDSDFLKPLRWQIPAAGFRVAYLPAEDVVAKGKLRSLRPLKMQTARFRNMASGKIDEAYSATVDTTELPANTKLELAPLKGQRSPASAGYSLIIYKGDCAIIDDGNPKSILIILAERQ